MQRLHMSTGAHKGLMSDHAADLANAAALALLASGHSSQSNPAWQTYKLEKYIQQSTDLLLCKVMPYMHARRVHVPRPGHRVAPVCGHAVQVQLKCMQRGLTDSTYARFPNRPTLPCGPS